MAEVRTRTRVVQPSGGREMTKQGEATMADVNSIMDRWLKFGSVNQPNLGRAVYGDFSSGMSYHEALDQVMEAQASFNALPAHIRKHCDNDPGKFLELVHDPARVGELEELGLIEAHKPETADPAPAPTPAPEPDPTP